MHKQKVTEKNVLVLQGGGALGAYQAGAYAALHEAGIEPDWVAGISIGSINSAIIAGNPKDKRVEKLREFWELISSGLQIPQLFFGEMGRMLYNEINAAGVATFGIRGFFNPRVPPAWLNLYATKPAAELSIYDTSPLRDTLLELIDFKRLNNDDVRLGLGAVNVGSGNFTYFDSEKIDIKPEHIMASGALPEGFPPIEIDGEWYWDGGLVSNTPLQYVVDAQNSGDMCVFQVDLFSATGEMPNTIAGVIEREKDIRFSSRTRLNTDIFKETQAVRHTLKRLLDKMPETLNANLLEEKEYALLKKWSCDAAVTVAHLIYRQKPFETSSKDYEFSRLSVDEHWLAGEEDVKYMLKQKAWKNRTRPTKGIKIFDFNRHEKGK